MFTTIRGQVCWYCHKHPGYRHVRFKYVGKDGDWYTEARLGEERTSHLHNITTRTNSGHKITKRVWFSTLPYWKPQRARI